MELHHIILAVIGLLLLGGGLGWAVRKEWEDWLKEERIVIDDKQLEEMEITHIKETFDIYQCINCGAHVDDNPSLIIHFKGCQKGEAKKWEKFYLEGVKGNAQN
jgi:hypothetical protein